jgi:hypothetical protein
MYIAASAINVPERFLETLGREGTIYEGKKIGDA